MAHYGLSGKLSVDITNLVADKAAEDPDNAATVRACALVSRSWRLGARPYVFRRIVVRDQKSLDAFDDLLRTELDVGGLVRELTLQGPMLYVEDSDPQTAWSLGALSRLSKKLPVLRTIRFQDLFCLERYKPNCEFFEGLAGLPSIDRLVLLRCGYHCREDFLFRCAGILPNLRHVEVTAPTWIRLRVHPKVDSALQAHYPEAHDALRLSSLSLPMAGGWQRSVLQWLVASPMRSHLRVLRIEIFQPFPLLTQVLEEVGPHPVELRLDFPVPFARIWPPQTVPIRGSVGLLKPCTRLRHLTLCFSDEDAVTSVIVLLEEVPTSGLEHLTLVLTQDQSAGRCVPILVKLRATLVAERFADVQAIDFEYVGPAKADVVREALTSVLPAAVIDKLTFKHRHRTPCMYCRAADVDIERCTH